MPTCRTTNYACSFGMATRVYAIYIRNPSPYADCLLESIDGPEALMQASHSDKTLNPVCTSNHIHLLTVLHESLSHQ